MHLPSSIAALAAASLPLAFPSTVAGWTSGHVYGFWTLRLYETSSPSGYTKSSITAEYWAPSGVSGGIVYCADVHIPAYGDNPGDHHTPCNDTTFSCRSLRRDLWTDTYLYEIRQTFDLDGKRAPLVGSKNLTMQRDKVTGWTFQADVTVDAELADEEASTVY
ncbi:hypothetical protein B0T26DRAFT_101070 [Lasiosphaeria miniovina]|uniref:Uncharacterized protein n=1 Tax=Lasiosphaeria miniovina TaxID=1954250 RepID=A0AA40E7B8_9PEZI|nr:uncharacterized protein B0T26DRAFT_101070 [Lasiosphaeria miniovina]KAK0726696.1 hypothetical protein B0T26DRAFT_101070 [Lasiosphaeria miniovina]